MIFKTYLNTLCCGAGCVGSVLVVGGTSLRGGYGATDGPGNETGTLESWDDLNSWKKILKIINIYINENTTNVFEQLQKKTCSTTGNTVKHGYNEHAKLLIPGTSL